MEKKKRKNQWNENTIIKTEDRKGKGREGKGRKGKERKGKERKGNCLPQTQQTSVWDQRRASVVTGCKIL